jgi:hypothetical protein
MALSRPIDILGLANGGSEGTGLGNSYDMSLGPASGTGLTYTWVTFSPVTSVAYKLQTSLASTDTGSNFSGFVIQNISGDHVNVSIVGSASGQTQALGVETSASSAPNVPAVGIDYSYATATPYFIQITAPSFAACVVGMECIAPGTVFSGVFVPGENVISSSGALGTLIGTVTGSAPTKFLHLMLTGGTAPGATDTWVGVSGAIYTATAVPSNFATIAVYDVSCNLLSTQLALTGWASGHLGATVFRLGRSGDTGSPAKTISGDYFVFDFARAIPTPCR